MHSNNTQNSKAKERKKKDPKVKERDVQFADYVDAFHLTLANRIRDAREAAHYTQKELGLLVGLKGEKTIQRMETHHMRTDPKTGVTKHTYKWVNSETLIEVCQILAINIADIWDSVMTSNSDT